MSAKHRVRKAIVKLAKEPDQSWAYETFQTGNTVVFAFESQRSADLIAEALRYMFKSSRPVLIHNGRKPRGGKA